MLSARNRMRRSEDFTDALRKGTRAATPTVVVHLDARPREGEPLVGFVVSKAVGNSVIRHRVQRQLRHLMRDKVTSLPGGSRVVVRALPPAAEAGSAVLRTDIDGALVRAAAKAGFAVGDQGVRR